ncbi:hypothetical protein [Spirosoma sordidisoli]|nr:hypothetical protein [Spirosoma sordidisoli]
MQQDRIAPQQQEFPLGAGVLVEHVGLDGQQPLVAIVEAPGQQAQADQDQPQPAANRVDERPAPGGQCPAQGLAQPGQALAQQRQAPAADPGE